MDQALPRMLAVARFSLFPVMLSQASPGPWTFEAALEQLVDVWMCKLVRASSKRVLLAADLHSDRERANEVAPSRWLPALGGLLAVTWLSRVAPQHRESVETCV